jgi:flagellar assembly protein FliH
MSEPAIERWQPRTITTVPTSHKSLEEVAEAARIKGYAEGLAQGQAEARKQSEETAAELLALWQSMSKPIASQDVEVSEHLLALVVTLTHAVLERELSTDSELIKATLDEALMCLAESEAPLTVTVNPADKALVESLLEEKRLPAELVADTTMLRGGCRLDRGHALVDATIESRIRSLVETMGVGDPLSEQANETSAVLDADRIQSIADRFSPKQDD